jgi:hypothetical protein
VTDATISNTAIGAGTVGVFGSYVTADKVYKATFTAGAVAGSAVVESKITASAVSGLAKPITSSMSTIIVADLADQVEILSKKLTKAEKKFNKLAKKWNKKFPTKKVKLIK